MFRRIVVGILCIFSSVLDPGTIQAMDIRLTSELDYSTSKSEREDRNDGSKSKGSTDRFQQTYRLDMNHQLSPLLTFNGGAQIEQNKVTGKTDGEGSEFRSGQVLPYLDAKWRQQLYTISGGYRKRFSDSKGNNLSKRKEYATSYDVRGEWRPLQLPRLEFSYLHLERSDNPLTVDRKSETLLLGSRFDYRDFDLRYSYLHGDDQNLLEDNSTQTATHNARLRFSRSYLAGRLSMSAGLRTELSELEFSGSGPRDFAVSPAGSHFYFIDSDPIPNNNDPDLDYQTDDFGDQLDLNSSNFLDIGLEFSDPQTVDKIQLKLAAGDVLDSGSNIDNINNWAVYVSEDQENWDLRTLVSVLYDREQDTLELVLNSGEAAEFYLVVYSKPLVTNQTGQVRVSDIRAFLSRDIDDGSQQSIETYQGQLSIGWQADPRTRFGYNLNVQDRRSSLFGERNSKLDTGLNISRRFNDVFTGTTRFVAGYSWDKKHLEESSYSYSARLSARYLDTLNQSLIYSGTYNKKKGDGNSLSNSLILRTNAEMYQGWDLSFDQGVTQQKSDLDATSTSYFLRLQNSLVPHESYNLIAEYTINFDRERGLTERSDSGRLRAFWVPRDTMSLAGELRYRKSDSSGEQISWEYSASWLPLRDGDLRFTLAYSEEEDQNGNRSWSFSPNLNWALTRYANLTLRYSMGVQETNNEITDFETAFLSFRIFYD